MKMKLESLPNELLIELFDYINDIQLLRQFYNLNYRFNRLLFIHSRKFHLNFRSITKKDFDFICRQSLPKILHQIISLDLSDDDDTPYQIKQFLSYNFHLHQFIHLQTLSFYHIRCANTLNQILSQLSQLQHLTSLKFDQIHFHIDEINQFVQTIWSLSKLIYFHISDLNFLSYSFMSESIISSSLKELYLMESHFPIDQLTHLFECTPHLEKLSIVVYQNFIYDNLILNDSLRDILPPLTKLNLKFIGVGLSDGLEYIFQLVPNLIELKIETLHVNFDGYEWEEMICNYLPKLKQFHLQMSIHFNANDDIEKQADEFLNSFQTSFWIDERQVFFRCHWNPEYLDSEQRCPALLYSLPYAFDTFDYMDATYSKSTCWSRTDYWFYNRVRNLCIDPVEKKNEVSQFPVRFFNIRHLTIGYDIEYVGKMCPVFDQLTTLFIQYLDCQNRPYLQTLLNRAPQLQTIMFYKNNWLYFFVANKSVRRLIIRDEIYYNVQQCAELCNSTLFNQCEVLEMNLRTRGSVLDLLRKMPNLRVLIIKCERDEWKENSISSVSKQDELVKWLKRYLPAECLIQREKYGSIRIWIR